MININNKKVPTIIILGSMTVVIIIFAVMFVQYNNAVMPKTLKTDEIDSLEKTLVEDYTEVKGLEVMDVGGVELSIHVWLNEEISEALSKDILLKIRNMLIGKEFANDIQTYYWSKYYLQYSFEVKYSVKKEALYTFYATRGVNRTNLELYEWDGYNHYTEENFKFILEDHN